MLYAAVIDVGVLVIREKNKRPNWQNTVILYLSRYVENTLHFVLNLSFSLIVGIDYCVQNSEITNLPIRNYVYTVYCLTCIRKRLLCSPSALMVRMTDS